MWRVAVVDDQASVRGQVESYFRRYQQEKGEQFRLSLFENAALFLDGYRPVCHQWI